MIKKLILGTILLAICHLSIFAQDITFSLSERKVPNSTTKTEKIIFQPNIPPTKEISSTIFKENTDYTGWLYSYHQLWEQLPQLEKWAKTIKPRYKYLVVIGMGGSSLSAETLRQLFGKQPKAPELIVLDTSHPDTLIKTERSIKLSDTLFIIASKSGSTTETIYAYDYFWEKMQKITDTPQKHFIAITDEGSYLTKQAHDKNFLALFINREDIGGRFSALSYFGMIPALLAGYDVEGILTSARQYSKHLQENPSLMEYLAQTLTPRQKNHKRLFLSLDKKLNGFGLWIEQMISESLGKEEKGIIPLLLNNTKMPHTLTKEDILIAIGRKQPSFDKKFFFLHFEKPTDIGKFFLLWEVVTVRTGELMKINPFNQPDVNLSKSLTKKILKEGNTDFSNTAFSNAIMQKIMQKNGNKTLTLKNILRTHTENVDYISLLLYIQPDNSDRKAIRNFVKHWQCELNIPFSITQGPRYLHSLGQLHKGGPNNGLFIIISQVNQDLFAKEKSFKNLLLAQSYGDFQALDENGRKAILINLPPEVSLKDFLRSVE